MIESVCTLDRTLSCDHVYNVFQALLYLETLDTAFIEPADETPSSPDLDRLRSEGVPTVADSEFADALDDLSKRRRKLLGIVTADARHWPPIDS